MTENITDGAAKRFRLAAAVLAAAMMLSGCAGEDDSVPDFSLPEVTEYLDVADALRTDEDETEISSSASESTVTEEILDSETVSAKDAASSQSESTTKVSAPQTTAVSSETTSAATVQTTESVQETTVASAAVPAESVTVTTTVHSTEIMTECSVPMAEPSVPVTAAAEVKYDAEFFSSDLFIGDSISTGYSLYGFLSEKNVFAKVGLNPSSVLTKSVSTCYGEIGIEEMLGYTMPKRVYVMLGSNGIQWLSLSNMLKSTQTLAETITSVCPDAQIVIISVPPVTAEYNSTVEDVNVMEKIDNYNRSLESYCSFNDILFVDASTLLKDNTGYFDHSYAESDGIHFKSSAYKTLLAKIQADVEEYEAENSPAETSAAAESTVPTETVTEKLSETSAESSAVTVISSETSAETLESKNE